MSKKIIAVLGATGAQGGGLVRAILKDIDSEFSVRAITRNVESEGARQLIDLGVEVVAADLDNEESLVKAFEGAYGAYAVTFYWAHFDGDKETREVKNIARAAKTAKLKHVVYSTMEDTREILALDDPRLPVLYGKYNIPHFDAKGEGEQFFKEFDVPATIMRTSFYWENFISLGMGPQKDNDGELIFNLPLSNKLLPGISSEDIGKSAYGVFKQGDPLIGKTIGIAGDHNTGEDIAKTFTSVTGREVNYKPLSFEEYRVLGFPGADDLANMFEFQNLFNEYYTGERNLQFTKTLNPELKSFKQWLEENKNNIPMP